MTQNSTSNPVAPDIENYDINNEDNRYRVLIELMNIHGPYSSKFMAEDFIKNYTKDPQKSLRENVADYIDAFEAKRTDTNTDAGYWIKLGHEPWKARYLADIAGDYCEMSDEDIIETFEEES